MSVFERALSQFSVTEQPIIRSRMQAWMEACRIGSVIVRNIDDKEHFLPESNMVLLLTAFLNSHGKEDEDLSKEYLNACRLNNMKLAGGKIETEFEPNLLGKAVEYDIFAAYLRQATYCTTEDEAEMLIDDLRDLSHTLTAGQEKILLSQHLTWATCGLESLDAEPFSFMAHNNADLFRATLGLPYHFRSIRGLILIVYHKPSDLEMYRPTVADAEQHAYFEPPPKSETRCGFTKPWNPGTTGLPADEEEKILKPRPECVHDPVEMANLRIPIEVIL